jgi:alkylglycerol monooxygenase
VVAMLTCTTLFYSSLTPFNKVAILIFILVTLINIGALLEQRKWIYYLECFRLILIFGFFFYAYNLLGFLIFPVIILIALERTFSLRKLYMKHVFKYVKAG